ncbi:MAG TPA: D-alanyl-D-alanine carboxypeptidase [Actinospica sp.]|nr:D-alanyl-D-alanine carboxypeptidase [Actinospica sp.]
MVDTKIEASLRPAQRRRRSRIARLLTTLGTLVLAVALLVGGVLWARGAFWAPVRLDQRISQTFTVPGAAPVLPWPTQGQAVVDVVGVGELGSSGPANTPVPIASVTKTMTAYQVLGDHPLLGSADDGPTIQVTKELFDASRGTDGDESGILIQTGEQLTLREALEGMLLPSAGNMARLLAAWDAGSIPAFVAKMNAEAHALGMAHTTYADPAGIDANSRSTAADQVKLGERVLQNATLSQIVSLKTAKVPAAGVVTNTNHLLGLDGDIGIKTGSTSEAGGCLLFAVHTTVDAVPVTLVGAVLGQPGLPWTILKNAETASKSLIEGAESALTVATVARSGQAVAELRQRGHSDVALTSANDVNVIGWPSLSYQVSVSRDRVLDVHSTLTPGAVVGSARLSAN